jgi:CheY-like chemotaxis protein
MKILVIDDDKALRSVLSDMIRSIGFESLEVPAGHGALKAVRDGDFDVLLTDVIMPEVDGVELVRAARAAKPGCAIIAMSGGSQALPAPIGLKLTEAFGADAVLYKPFTRADLAGAINAVCPNRPGDGA